MTLRAAMCRAVDIMSASMPVGDIAEFIVPGVGPDQGVEVDRAPPLELDHLHVGQPQLPGRFPGTHAEQCPEGPQGVDGGPAPELGDPGVEQHRSLVVVAPGTEGLADEFVGLVVPASADQRPPVGAGGTGRMAGAVGSPAVDGAEARGGEGQEDGRVLGDGLGDVLATPEPCGHQGEGVSPVEGGTGWTERLPSRPTRLEQHPVGQVRVSKEIRGWSPSWPTRIVLPERRTGRRQPRMARTWDSKAS